jgi:hypothetical protein
MQRHFAHDGAKPEESLTAEAQTYTPIMPKRSSKRHKDRSDDVESPATLRNGKATSEQVDMQ